MAIEDSVVSAIILDIVDTFPADLSRAFKQPAGRTPSAQSVRMQMVLNKLTDDESETLVRAVVDATLAALLSLIDQNFKDSIVTTFEADSSSPAFRYLLREKYRQLVAPGGTRSQTQTSA